MTEFALIEALRPLFVGDRPGVPLGVGDDAAVVEVAGSPMAIAVDALVENVHFDLTISSYADVGWKALAANVSDLAAVGARTVAAVVALVRPSDADPDRLVALERGMAEAAERYGVALVGGDVTDGPGLAVAVTVVGELVGTAPLRRDRACPGDVLVVVGSLGAAAAGLALHRAGADDLLARHPHLSVAHRRPDALPGAGAALVAAGAHAAIDVSDGLGRDLAHVARASGIRIVVDARRLPADEGVAAAAERLGSDPVGYAVGGGDDLALAATLAPDAVPALAEQLATAALPWAQVGHTEAGTGVVLVRPDGGAHDISRAGWEHGRDRGEGPR